VWHETAQRWFSATGARGIYSLFWSGGCWWLTGKGHDGLLMMALPPFGQRFGDRDQAELHADWIECHGAEGEVSGAG
jgi:hypothetical protein